MRRAGQLQTETDFAGDAKSVLHQVRIALAALVESVGADASYPQEMARRFALDKSLAWRVARVIDGDDAVAAATHMPGRGGLSTFLDALRRCGAPTERIDSVRVAMERFERLVDTHSGDRGTLEIMLGGVSDHLSRKRTEAFRKLAFQGNSAIWGAQARTQASLHFVAPSATPGKLDLAGVSGLIDFRRLRSDVRWSLATRVDIKDDGTHDANASTILPLDPDLGPDDLPLLRAFCSRPMVEIEEVRASPGHIRYEIAEGPVGITAATTCLVGWMYRGQVSGHRTDVDQFGEHAVSLNTPVETLVHDLYIHRSLAFAIPPTTAVYGQVPGGPVYPRDGRDKGLIPLSDSMIDLGAGPPDCTISALPRCTQMVEFAASRLGWKLGDFHGFRYRLRYPPIPALALFRYALPPRD
jgi:hypothetical protein